MNESSASTSAATAVPEPLATEEISQFLARLALPSPASDDAARVDRLRVMERVKNALCAAQAHETVAFEASQLAAQELAGTPARRRGRGISDQAALARMESPHKGSRLLGLAKALVNGELPQCLAALTRGEVSEWRVTCVARETAHLRVEDRQIIDAELGPRLGGLGDRGAADAARALAQRLDPAAAVERARRAENERRISIRPAPDAMTYVTALLPTRDGVAVYAALERLAKDALASGDERGKAQLMADTLVERVTGHRVGAVPIRLHLVMTPGALTGTDSCPAGVPGHGTVPAGIAQDWLRQLVLAPVVAYDDLVKVNRLFTAPGTGDLIAMESTRRGYAGLLRTMVTLRDQACRTPWCDAAISHLDHVERHEDGGATSYDNGRGLCVRCNLAREAVGWRAAVTSKDGQNHRVTVSTPTGHRYTSSAPPVVPTSPSGARPDGSAESARSAPSRAGPHAARRAEDGAHRRPALCSPGQQQDCGRPALTR